MIKGNFADPEATVKEFRGGYFSTGDAAVVHPDGYVEIRDRYNDVIISGGENISSIEVEGALLRHPAILEVAVVGMPHERWGESPHAFVVLRPGRSSTAEEMRAVRAQMYAMLKADGAAPVGTSVLLESAVLGLLGGVVGGLLVYFGRNGYQATTLNFVSFSQLTFAFTVTPRLLVTGLGYSLILGIVGGLLPGIRAARMPVTTGLREL